MKKILFLLAVVSCAVSASAQNWSEATNKSNWAAGLRIGSGLQAQAEYYLSSDNYVEGRFGMSWCNAGATAMADFTALYNWHILDMNWTPKAGDWFFDAGVGLNVGGRGHYAYVGAAGCAKFGIKFNKVPLKLAADWTPVFGAEVAYVKYSGTTFRSSQFYKYGLANLGISCVYCF